MASVIGSRAFCFSDGEGIFHTYIIMVYVVNHYSGRPVSALDSVCMLPLAPLRAKLHRSDALGRVFFHVCLLRIFCVNLQRLSGFYPLIM